jgi:tetratricopeptide (TPR) repeat protein
MIFAPRQHIIPKHIIIVFSFLIVSLNIFSQEDFLLEADKDYLSIVSEKIDSNKYREALQIVQEQLQNGEDEYPLLEKRAIIYYGLKDKKKSFKDVDNVIFENRRYDIRLYPIISLYYIDQKKNFDAVNSLIYAYKLSNGGFLHSLLKLSNTDKKKLLQAVATEFAKEDTVVDLYPVRGFLNYSINNLNEAHSDFITSLVNEPENEYLYFIFGETKLKRKEYLSAVVSYNSAIFYGYNDLIVYKQRALSKGFIDDFKGAIEDYNHILKQTPNDYEIYYLRGIAKNYLRDYNGALSDLNKAIKINSNFASAYNYRGIVYGNKDDYPAALMDFDKTLLLSPNHPFTFNNIGLAQVKVGQNSKALTFFTKAIELDHTHADPYYNRGKLKFDKGDIKGAKEDLIRTIELNFHNPDAHYHMALIYIHEKTINSKKKLEDKICSELDIASRMNHLKAQELFNQLCKPIEVEENQEEDLEENSY